jgi:hypothetical protein
MTLDARRIALQGIGYVAIAIASQGFLPLDQVVQPQPVVMSGGGGGQVSQSEWLRRFKAPEPQTEPLVVAEAIDLAKAAREAKRKRLRAEEELLFILG